MTTPDEELISACIGGDLASAKAALRTGADVKFRDERGFSAFLVAAGNGHMELAELLLDKGAELHVSDNAGATPLLRLVAGHNDVAQVAQLITWGAQVDETNRAGWTPLMVACTWDDRWIQVVRLLLERGADVNHVANDDWTPLLLAVNRGFRGELLPFLFARRELDVHMRTPQYGWTPLIHAAAGTNLEAVRKLIELGAELNAAMRIAPGKPYFGTDYRFREAGAIKAKPEHDGFTALHWAVLKKRRAQKPLLEAGADMDAKARDGRTPRSLGATVAAPVRAAEVNQEAELLDAIGARPDDADLRRVWADWLLDQSNPWGEVVQRAMRLATSSPDARESKALVALEKKHARAFLAPLGPFVRRATFDRGLIRLAVGDANAFPAVATAVAQRAPGATIELTGLKKKGVQGLAMAPFGRFGEVKLDSNRIDDATLAALGAGTCFEGLERLSLLRNVVTDRGAIALAGSPRARSLIHLGITSWPPDVTLTVAALDALLTLPSLHTLSISCWGPGWARVVAGAPQLRHLKIGVSEFDDADALALAASSQLESLHVFTHRGSIYDRQLALTDAGAAPLLERVRTVVLSGAPALSPALAARSAVLSSSP